MELFDSALIIFLLSIELWIPVHQQTPTEMHNDGQWQHARGEHTQLLRELRCQPIVVEHKPLVNPVLNEQDEKVSYVKNWHTCRESECHEYCEKHLRISHL